MDELGVRSRPTSMGFSVRCDQTGLEYNGSSFNGLFALRSNLLRPRFHRMLRDILRFNREAAALGTESGQTVGEFLHEFGYGREFAQYYLLPMGAAIWSCPTGTFEQFPIAFVVEFYRNHGLLSITDRPTWRVIEGGSRSYVEALLARFGGPVHLRTPIVRVARFPDRVELTPRGSSPVSFDHVVFACHADQALRMLADASPVERELLAEFPYERNTAVLHTDISVLPRRRRACASWNYRLSRDSQTHATVTYCMSMLQQINSQHVFNVTLNGDTPIDPARVLGEFVYEHPIFTTRRASAQARHAELIDNNRSSYCGAYWRYGFHEDGVVSALAVSGWLNRGVRPTRHVGASEARPTLAPSAVGE
jgi:predicted NAD/FAD-binding protein